MVVSPTLLRSLLLSTITQLAHAIQFVLTDLPHDFARSSGFTQRSSKLSAADFVQLLVAGWLANPQASLQELVATPLPSGVVITA